MRLPRLTRAATATVAGALAPALLTAACTSAHHPTTPGSTGSSAVASASGSGSGGSAAAASSAAVAGASASGSPASAPTASTPAAQPSSAAPRHPVAVWGTYHHDAARSGAASSAASVQRLTVAASAQLDAAVYASPLVLRDGHGDLVITATENNTVYGLRNNGSVVWSRHIAPPVRGSSLPCGDIDPTGITGTPVYDATSGLVFVLAFESGLHHVLVALDAESGAIAWTRPVDPPGSHPNVEQERAALLLSGGRVWVAFGGLYGDCGPYHGYVVGIATSGQGGAAAIYQVPSAREAGIWTAAGAAADGQGHVYVSVGNGAQENPRGPYDMSDSVIELNGTQVVSYFAPAGWASENARDLDLGTTGPLLLPGGLVFVAGKDGYAYLLHQGALGGVGAKVPSIALCRAFGGAAYSAGTVFVPCTDGVRAVHVTGATLTPAWHAGSAGSPIVGGGAVLTVQPSSGVLYALDPGSGAVKSSVSVGDTTTRFGTPAMAADGFVYVGTTHGHLVVVRTS